MRTNFCSWGELNRIGLQDDPKVVDKADAFKKLDERLQKYRDKLSFVDQYKASSQRKPML
jgi:hypothetical protein